ncbi:MAG TPA: GntR family transcriptional regulator, partial [Thermoleophilaceae bacterium]|nr:GntR family transcriptional regulator [Thermoleophilaceae bacterium]
MTGSRGPSAPELLAVLDRERPQPLHSQLEQALRDHIRAGRLAPGTRLPSTRRLAADLGVARGVVSEAYAQLGAEGWLVGRRGGGTTVADRAVATPGGPDPATAGHERERIKFDFGVGVPDLSAFPRRRWLAALRAAL